MLKERKALLFFQQMGDSSTPKVEMGNNNLLQDTLKIDKNYIEIMMGLYVFNCPFSASQIAFDKQIGPGREEKKSAWPSAEF